MWNAKLDLVHRKITRKQKILPICVISKIMVKKSQFISIFDTCIRALFFFLPPCSWFDYKIVVFFTFILCMFLYWVWLIELLLKYCLENSIFFLFLCFYKQLYRYIDNVSKTPVIPQKVVVLLWNLGRGSIP